jgi:protein transport protein SEC24
MSDYQLYHALGQGGPNDDPNNPNPDYQPGAPQFQPAVAPSPYQQQGMNYNAPGQNQPYNSSQMGPPSPYGAPQSPGYFPDQGVQGQDGGLAAQMGGLGLGEVATHGKKKKKDRHAYHTVEAPSGSSAAFNGIPQGGVPPSAYLNADPSVTPAQGGQFLNQPITPQMSQFPASVNAPFNPGNPASPAEFAARNGTPNPGFSANMQTSAQGRVDPDQIPSVPRSRDAIAQYYLTHVYPTFEHHLPPPASVAFVAFDQGNSSPKFTRLTMNSIPSTSDALASTGLPLGLLLQPLAPLQPGELEIPVLDFGETGPPRCHRCRAYINPFMVFRSGGNKFVCNMCNYANDVPPEYFCATTPQGARVDREQRPELMRGTVEFLVPKEYWSKEPVGLRWLFLIDVGQEAFNKGFLEAFCEGIMAALYGGDEEPTENGEIKRKIPPGSKVGFVTFDKDIHFYNMNPALDQAQMMIMPDIEDPFVPLGEGLFVDPYEAKSNITSLLSQLPTLFSQIKNPEPALLPTLHAALAALEKTGGKIICSLSALPTWGPGRLFLRDDGKQHGGDAEKKLLDTEHPGWRKAAEKMVTAGIGVDFFLAAPGGGYLDIATIGGYIHFLLDL